MNVIEPIKESNNLTKKSNIINKTKLLPIYELRVTKNHFIQLRYERQIFKTNVINQKLYKNKFLQLQIETNFYEKKLAKLISNSNEKLV
jgi:hypothetical protein